MKPCMNFTMAWIVVEQYATLLSNLKGIHILDFEHQHMMHLKVKQNLNIRFYEVYMYIMSSTMII